MPTEILCQAKPTSLWSASEYQRNIPDAVKDFICHFGATAAFLSDSTTENKGYEIEDVEHNYNTFRHHYSEPEYQNQTG